MVDGPTLEGSRRPPFLGGVTTIGLVCRFKPLHVVHAALLETLCERAGRLLIGVGSSNRYDADNPFTCAETVAMVERVLRPRFANFESIPVPDLGHGPRWRAQLVGLFGPLDLFVTANAYVAALLRETYPLAHPRELVPAARHAPVDGARVRRALARGEPWEHLVPPEVADYLREGALPERFRREFGLATLAAGFGPDARTRRERDVLLGR